eukprot:7500125-Ditylum_brightwellii.AAC.2
MVPSRKLRLQLVYSKLFLSVPLPQLVTRNFAVGSHFLTSAGVLERGEEELLCSSRMYFSISQFKNILNCFVIQLAPALAKYKIVPCLYHDRHSRRSR